MPATKPFHPLAPDGTSLRRGLLSATCALALAAGAGAQFVQVSAGPHHSLAVRTDGSVVAWGDNAVGQGDFGLSPLPPDVTWVQVDAGGQFANDYMTFEYSSSWDGGTSVGLRSDGSIEGFGFLPVSDTPVLPVGHTCVEVSAGSKHALARLSDGSVMAWGNNQSGQCNVPPLPAGLEYDEVSAGGFWETEVIESGGIFPTYTIHEWFRGHSVARRSDGTVVAWGDSSRGQANVPALPPGVTYVQVSAGADHTLALRSDGEVVAWGGNQFGQCNVPAAPPGLTCVSVAAGGGTSAALLSDGSLAVWGVDVGSVPALPPGLGWDAVSVGGWLWVWRDIPYHGPETSGVGANAHILALRSDGSVAAWGDNEFGQCDGPPETWTDLGGGTTGVFGQPLLSMTGTLQAASPLTLDLVQGAPSALALVFISFSSSPAPFLGGTLSAWPADILLVTGTEASGELTASARFPGAASGQQMWFQVANQDLSVPVHGGALSNAVRGTVP